MADYRKIRAQQEKSWLQSFPEEVYNLSDTSHIVRLANALCGDSGVGAARKTLMIKRLQTALAEVRYTDLDLVYNGIFDFPRLEEEKYPYQATDLLTAAQRHEMDIKDASYRKRIAKYMKAFQYGGTRAGLELAAESIFGLDCEVVSVTDYHVALGLPLGDTSYQYIGENAAGEVDEREFVVIVMSDDDITEEQSYLAHKIARRLMPADTIVSFKTRAEVFSIMGMSDKSRMDIPMKVVESSSDWWEIKKIVTGRIDWDYEKYSHLWIEPGVAKEAPVHPLVYCQEETLDVTHMIKSITASTEHIGNYNREQSIYFRMLANEDADILMPAENAIATASYRRYLASYYGGEGTIDWSYPLAYTPELNNLAQEKARALRYWSSEEKTDGEESLVLELARIVPISCIKLEISQKPVRIVPYASSAVDDDGNRIWHQIASREGLKLSYVARKWGGSSIGGEFDSVEFSFATLRANAIKLVFERLDYPYYEAVADQTYVEHKFPYSYEVANLSVLYELRERGDYIDATYEDVFGNRVDTELVEYKPSLMLDDNWDTYWLSQPNIAEEAIEYVILDVRQDGNPVKLNTLNIDVIFGGCQLNIYSTEDSEPGKWKPYTENYELDGSTITLPTRNVTYLKLEFTRLCAIPYQIAFEDVVVKSRLYPESIKRHINKEWSQTYSQTDEQQLLYIGEDESYSTTDVYGDAGIEAVYADILSSTVSPIEVDNKQYITDGPIYSGQYSRLQDSPILAVYGDETALETPLSQSILSVEANQNPRIDYKFYEEGEHAYFERWDERTFNLAYVVGIREIRAGFDNRLFAPGYNTPFVMPAYDNRAYIDVDGWELVSDERMKVSTDEYMCSMELGPVQTILPFRTFDFAVNQNPAREIFRYPSSMMNEWSGLNTDAKAIDFGISGDTVQIDVKRGISGLQSEPKLLRSLGIATYQLDVFDRSDGEWILDALDFEGGQVFSMRYDIEKGKWNTLGVTFSPQPSGSWWNRDYKYRMRIPVKGPITKGSAIFVPVIDFDALLDTRTSAVAVYPSTSIYPSHDLFPLSEFNDDGIVRDDFKDVRVVYYNGVSADELNVDITDNMEWWFASQGELAVDEEADASYHFDTNRFVGGYYVYFGYRNETNEPLRDYTKVFKNGRCWSQDVSTHANGTWFNRDESSFDIEDYRINSGPGFISMEFTPTSEFIEVEHDSIGKPEIRFLLDYEDGSHAVQMYTHEKQLTFVIKDGDYESAFVSNDLDLFERNVKSYILVEWGARGSAPVTKNTIIERRERPDGSTELIEESEIDPDDKRRRKIDVYVDGYEPIECIPNVYDETRYLPADEEGKNY